MTFYPAHTSWSWAICLFKESMSCLMIKVKFWISSGLSSNKDFRLATRKIQQNVQCRYLLHFPCMYSRAFNWFPSFSKIPQFLNLFKYSNYYRHEPLANVVRVQYIIKPNHLVWLFSYENSTHVMAYLLLFIYSSLATNMTSGSKQELQYLWQRIWWQLTNCQLLQFGKCVSNVMSNFPGEYKSKLVSSVHVYIFSNLRNMAKFSSQPSYNLYHFYCLIFPIKCHIACIMVTAWLFITIQEIYSEYTLITII